MANHRREFFRIDSSQYSPLQTVCAHRLSEGGIDGGLRRIDAAGIERNGLDDLPPSPG
jgi:hypothetical protein